MATKWLGSVRAYNKLQREKIAWDDLAPWNWSRLESYSGQTKKGGTMARKRFNAEQIVAILREAERAPRHDEVLRTHGISAQTFYRWERMYGGNDEEKA